MEIVDDRIITVKHILILNDHKILPENALLIILLINRIVLILVQTFVLINFWESFNIFLNKKKQWEVN